MSYVTSQGGGFIELCVSYKKKVEQTNSGKAFPTCGDLGIGLETHQCWSTSVDLPALSLLVTE